MGHYTGHNFRVLLRPDTPEGLIEHLRELAAPKNDGEALPSAALRPTSGETGLALSHDAVKEMLAEISYTMHGWSAYIGSWNSSEANKLQRQDDGRWLLYTKASSKYTHNDSIMAFLNSLLPFLGMQDGDILFRAIYEEGVFEDIYYLAGDKVEYKEGGGYYYFDSYDDDEHPGNKCPVDWDPPFVVTAMLVARDEKLTEHPMGLWWKDPWIEPPAPEEIPEEPVKPNSSTRMIMIDSLSPMSEPEPYEPHPFVVRPFTDDLPENIQRGYSRKEEVEINGQKYIRYFGPFSDPTAEPRPFRAPRHVAVIGEHGLEPAKPEISLGSWLTEGGLLNGGLSHEAMMQYFTNPIPGMGPPKTDVSLMLHRAAVALQQLWPKKGKGMGRYYSESVDIPAYLGNGVYAKNLYYTHQNLVQPGDRTRKIRPARAKHLAKLERYMARVNTLARPKQKSKRDEGITPWT